MSGADQEPRRWRTEENDAEGNGKGGKEDKGLSVVLSAKCTCIYDNTFDTNKYKLGSCCRVVHPTLFSRFVPVVNPQH